MGDSGRETGSYWWQVFTFVYMTTLAYLCSLLAYQGGTWLGWRGRGRRP